jgi:hypothetical protein
MDYLKQVLAKEVKSFVASLAEKGLSNSNANIEYFGEDNLSCTLRVYQPEGYGPRYFVIKVSEMM